VAAGYDGQGKVVIITGASTGLGYEAARVLAARGCQIVVGARDLPKAQVRGWPGASARARHCAAATQGLAASRLGPPE
jgi:NAD(P)-dependent dehydrogenase (short-subunit alcohol dehydrogenase family)